MSGTNPVATFAQSNFNVDTATTYKTKIDSNSIVMQRIVDNFAPRQASSPNMTVVLDAGHVFKGTTLTEVASQTTGTFTAPGGNPRIDRVYIDRFTGAVGVATGTPAVSPAAPAIPSGKVPIAQVLLQTSSVSITNSMITDERDLAALGRGLAGEENIGAWLKDDGSNNLTINVNATLIDDGTGKLTTGMTAEQSIASAATCDLGSKTSNVLQITSTTTITSFGSSASTANPLYFLRFAGALTLTYNATSMILPGAANITTAAGDTAVAKYEGSGNWRIISYSPISGQAVSTQPTTQQSFTSTGSSTWNKPSGYPASAEVLVQCWGAGASGATDNGGGTGGGGGGGGQYVEWWTTLGNLASSVTVTIGAGGAARGPNTATPGAAGGNTTFGSLVTALGGGAGTGSSSGSLGGNGGGFGVYSSVDGAGGIRASTTPPTGSYFIGGGGGYAGASSNANGAGAPTIWSGAGGGGSSNSTITGTGGTSMFGGNGSTATIGGAASAGAQPGGGGGGSRNGASGKGGDGQCVVTVFG